MDLPFIAASAFQAVNLIVKGYELKRGATSTKDQVSAETKTAHEITLNMWGSLLFEMKVNCERARLLATSGAKYAPFDFTVSDALMPDFCRAVPTPFLLSRFQFVLAALKRIDFFQRAAGQFRVTVASDGSLLDDEPMGLYIRATNFANDAVNRTGLIKRFNDLIKLGHLYGKEVHGSDWAGDAARIFPAETDEEAAIDQSHL